MNHQGTMSYQRHPKEIFANLDKGLGGDVRLLLGALLTSAGRLLLVKFTIVK